MKIYLGLGSNIGDRASHIQEAVHRLDNTSHISILSVSSVYETVPVGGPEQHDFMNAAVEGETGVEAEELLTLCMGIEREMGRMRTVRLGPRIIDIDILFYWQLSTN